MVLFRSEKLSVRDGYAAITAIYHSVWHETQAPFMPPEECKLRKPQFFEKRMSALFATTLVAERAGSIVGFASWQDHLLGQIYVSTAHRGVWISVGTHHGF